PVAEDMHEVRVGNAIRDFIEEQQVVGRLLHPVRSLLPACRAIEHRGIPARAGRPPARYRAATLRCMDMLELAQAPPAPGMRDARSVVPTPGRARLAITPTQLRVTQQGFEEIGFAQREHVGMTCDHRLHERGAGTWASNHENPPHHASRYRQSLDNGDWPRVVDRSMVSVTPYSPNARCNSANRGPRGARRWSSGKSTSARATGRQACHPSAPG